MKQVLCSAVVFAAGAMAAGVRAAGDVAPAGAVITATDRRVAAGLSPYNWVRAPDSISSAVCGASVALRFRGTRRVDLQVDTEALRKAGVEASRCPVLAWTVNGGPERTHQLAPGDASVPLVADTANPEIDLYIKGMSPFEDRYNGDVPLGAVKITGFAVDRGGVARAARVPRRVWLNIGDSIMSGDGAAYRAGQGRPPDGAWPAAGAARASYGYLLARHFGCREARLAYGGYTWMGGLAGLPPLGELIDQRTSTISRLNGDVLDPPPDVVLVNLGENIVPAEREVIETLDRIRLRTGPRARLIVMIPVSGRGRTEITRAFAAWQSAAADARAHLVDAGAVAFATCDGQHPVAEGHTAIYNAVLPRFEAILGRGGK